VSIEHREADVGYGLRRDVRGRGLATEAARLMLRFGFRDLGLHRVFATHHPDNAASAHVLTRLGMTREGVLREHRFANGTWRDSILYSILEHELAE
jgi:RimJ/RimL family protein N-acetyltransferase